MHLEAIFQKEETCCPFCKEHLEKRCEYCTDACGWHRCVRYCQEKKLTNYHYFILFDFNVGVDQRWAMSCIYRFIAVAFLARAVIHFSFQSIPICLRNGHDRYLHAMVVNYTRASARNISRMEVNLHLIVTNALRNISVNGVTVDGMSPLCHKANSIIK